MSQKKKPTLDYQTPAPPAPGRWRDWIVDAVFLASAVMLPLLVLLLVIFGWIGF